MNLEICIILTVFFSIEYLKLDIRLNFKIIICSIRKLKYITGNLVNIIIGSL